MTTLRTFSPAEIADAMRRAGFSEDRIKQGVAIVFAESGGRSEATNDNPGVEKSVGPWQINLLAHPGVDEDCARDIVCSTKEAFRISGAGTSWAPWGAFTNGSYAKYLDLYKDSPTSPKTDDGNANDGAGSSSVTTSACAGVPADTINNIKIMMGNMLKVHTDPAKIAESLKQLYPGVAVTCLQSIAYGSADAIKQAPDQQAAKAVGDAVSGITKATDLLKPENMWRAGFVALGALMVFFGGRIYLGTPEPAKLPEVTQ